MRRYEHGGDIYGEQRIWLDFSVNTNPLGMPDEVKAAVINGADEYARYPDPFCRELTRTLAKRHRVAPEMVLCGNGAADMIFRIAACLRPRNVLMPQPTFSEYARSTELFGGKVWNYPLKAEHGFLLGGEFTEAIRRDTDMVFLCTPNNPTGRLIPLPLIRRTAEKCREIGALLVLDECFIEFTGGGSMDRELMEHPNILLLRAFTKFYAMAGLRLGYLLCADTALLRKISRYGAEWSVSAPAQRAGLAALGTQGWRKKTESLVAEERAFLTGELRALGIAVFESDANFLLIKTRTPLFERLKAQGILLRRCENFPGLNEEYLRIGLKGRNENLILIEKIREAV